MKCLVSEVREEHAERLLAGGHDLHVIDFFYIECNNVLAGKVRRAQISVELAPMAAQRLPSIVLRIHSTARLLGDAFDLALMHEVSVYDALYLALALRLGCQFVTADRKLYDATIAAFPETLLWVEDIPAASR